MGESDPRECDDMISNECIPSSCFGFDGRDKPVQIRQSQGGNDQKALQADFATPDISTSVRDRRLMASRGAFIVGAGGSYLEERSGGDLLRAAGSVDGCRAHG